MKLFKSVRATGYTIAGATGDLGSVLIVWLLPSLYLCGDALLCLGQHQEALAYLDQAVQMQPNHVDALLARGELHMEMGDDKSAMSDFNEVPPALSPRLRISNSLSM